MRAQRTLSTRSSSAVGARSPCIPKSVLFHLFTTRHHRPRLPTSQMSAAPLTWETRRTLIEDKVNLGSCQRGGQQKGPFSPADYSIGQILRSPLPQAIFNLSRNVRIASFRKCQTRLRGLSRKHKCMHGIITGDQAVQNGMCPSLRC